MKLALTRFEAKKPPRLLMVFLTLAVFVLPGGIPLTLALMPGLLKRR